MSNHYPTSLGQIVRAVATLGVSEAVRRVQEINGSASNAIVPLPGQQPQTLAVQQAYQRLAIQENRHEVHHVEVHTVTNKFSGSDSAAVTKRG